MLTIWFWLIVAFVVIAFGIRLIVRWSMNFFARHVEDTLRSADTIVNDERVPEPWLQPFREELARARHKDGVETGIERVAARARARCLGRLDKLIQTFEGGAFTDKPETRDILVQELRSARRRWTEADWQTILLAPPREDA